MCHPWRDRHREYTAPWRDGLDVVQCAGAVLAGLLTFVYPPVGADVRYTRLVWGQPRRALLPWLALLWLVLLSVLRSMAAR